MTQPAPTARAPIWLIVSIAINLLLVGAIAGRMMAPVPVATPPEQNVRMGLERAPRFGGAQTRQAAREHLRAAWTASSPLREDLDKARAELKEAITASPYVESTVDEAFETMRIAEGKLQASTHEYLSEALAETPADQRVALAEMMLRERGRFDRRNRSKNRRGHNRLDRDNRQRDQTPPSER